ncbi:MAG: trypsin-like peptidase domain-containing protein [Pseudomonadota bacterium]
MVPGGFQQLIAITSLVAALCLNTPSAWAYVFGKDDRVPLPSKLEHLKYKIGFLYTRSGKYGCTASCVAEDTILTAAHCVLGGRGKRSAKPAADLKFYLPNKYLKGRYNSADVLHAGDYLPRNVLTGVGGKRTYNGRNSTLDWAFVKLSVKACTQGSLGLKSLKMGEIAKAGKAGKLMEVAFHGDKNFGEILYYTNKCRIKGIGSKRKRARVAKTIRHTCDLVQGASGSPLLMSVDGKLSIVGLNVAERYTQRYLRRGKKIIKYYKRKPTYNLAVHPSTFIDHLDQLTPVKLVLGARRLEQIQEGLKERKLYTGPIDGVFGPATRKAIRTYQKSLDYPILGMPTVSLWQEIGTPTVAKNEDKPDSQLTELERLSKKRLTLSGKARNALTLEIYRKRMERVTATQAEWARKNAPTAGDVKPSAPVPTH